MKELTGASNKCDRCGEWHQRLFPVYDNITETYQHICRKCVGELAISACPEWLVASLTKTILQRISKSLVPPAEKGRDNV